MNQLSVQRYQFNCRVQQPLKLNFYSGSMLRGAFGRALRKAVCVTHMTDCTRCLLYRQCAYPKIFETPSMPSRLQQFSRIPHPFVLEPPPIGQRILEKGDTFSFNLVLIGPALNQLPIIIYACQSALQAGLGAAHARAELLDVVFEPDQPAAQVIYTAGSEARLLPSPTFTPEPFSNAERIKVQLVTPLHVKKQGKATAVDGKDFIKALIRRYYLLLEFYTPDYQPPDFTRLSQLAGMIDAKSHLHWCDWQRYSSSQRQQMSFGGYLGDLELSGNLAPFLSLLTLGQWFHVGNKSTFGMGYYRLISAN